MLGFPDITEDARLFAEKSERHGESLVVGLREIVFAPDGIGRFEDAWQRRVVVEGFPVCHIDDIIARKVATNRQKDRESLPRLESFRLYLRRQGSS